MVLAMATSVTLGNTLDAPSRRLKSDVFFSRALALCETQIRCAASVDIGEPSVLPSLDLDFSKKAPEVV